ncbi:Hypothetical predicted protein [Mytilus galloprovincialis]|uniref:Uncharacterized protein n=1 Tax=Mytilus galloprovincialis TaxID=29158 RepID=A0A8B6CH37_MYTGA|nr:Hypothetical predicted protein [Mytilus galloprovincialis]
MGTVRSTARIKRTGISGKSTTASTETRKSVSRTTTNLKNFTELTTESSNINKETSLATSRLNKTDISEISTTSSPGTRQSDLETAYVTEQRIKTADININHVKTSPSSNEMSIISEDFTTTASSRIKSLIYVKITTIIVITVVGALIAIVVILLLYRRKRKRIIYHSRNSASNDIHASLEGEQTIQMFSSNDRSRDKTNTVPFILQQKQRPGNISVSNYQDPIDMENQYQGLDSHAG